MSRPHLDWHNPIAVSAWLGALRVTLNDLDTVSQDMLRPPRERDLGPRLHAENYRAAWKQVVQAIEYATAPEPDPEDGEPGDPSGNGGAGPTH